MGAIESMNQRVSRLLIDEPPLQVLPSLAKAIGLNEALLLQQIHYWLQRSTHVVDGVPWVYNSYKDWQKQFPFWSIPTIQRITARLEKMGILISSKKNKAKFNQTKFYTIDHIKLISSNHSNLICSSITENTTEITDNSSADATELSNNIVKRAREEKQLTESREMWPEWYSLLFGIPGFKTPYDQVNKWRLDKGISEELAEEQAYGLRDWWPRRPRKRQGGDPYATFQNWCNKELKGNKEQRNGNYKSQVKAGPEVGTTFAELLGN